MSSAALCRAVEVEQRNAIENSLPEPDCDVVFIQDVPRCLN
jgi:hypothetical protein